MKRLFTAMLIALLVAAFALPGYAGGLKHGGYGQAKMGIQKDCKFMKAAHKMLENKKELELTKDQQMEIKRIVAETKKDLIKRDANIQTLKVEIDTLTWEAPYNINDINALISQKYDLKRRKAHFLVRATDSLHKVLSDKQMEKFNEL